jgi:cell division septum initiation protein DivIVA
MSATPTFALVIRGYDRRSVNQLVDVVQAALASPDLARRRKALQALSSAQFMIRMRGYDRQQVDTYISGARAGLNGRP